MRSTLVLVTVVLALLGTSASDMPYTVCKKAPFAPSSVTLDPNPATAGSSVHFQINGTADRRIQGGTFDAKVYFVVGHFSMPVYSESKDLCDRTICPIEKGPVTFTYDKLLPAVTPSGNYKVEIDAYDGQHQLEMCLTVRFSIHSSDAASAEDERVLDLGALKLAWLEVEPKLWEEPSTTTTSKVDTPQARVVY